MEKKTVDCIRVGSIEHLEKRKKQAAILRRKQAAKRKLTPKELEERKKELKQKLKSIS